MPSTENKKFMRQLGRNGPWVSMMGLGAMGMSEYYGETNEEENIAVLNRAIDLGCTFWDTADGYGNGKNEELLAKVLKTRRSEVFICTKFGIVREGGLGFCGKPEYVRQACEASLKRLGIETIDLYYQHRVDPNTPVEETWKALKELVQKGKVRYLGISQTDPETIRRAHAIHPISAYQVEYSPWCLDIEENGSLAVCRELGIAIVPYSPLGRGFMTGQIKSPDDFAADDFRRTLPRFRPGAFEKNLELVKKFQEMAEKKGLTSAQLCLAWVMAQGDDFIPIPGTKRLKYLEANWGATSAELSTEEVAQIREIIKSIPIEGDHYDWKALKFLGNKDSE